MKNNDLLNQPIVFGDEETSNESDNKGFDQVKFIEDWKAALTKSKLNEENNHKEKVISLALINENEFLSISNGKNTCGKKKKNLFSLFKKKKIKILLDGINFFFFLFKFFFFNFFNFLFFFHFILIFFLFFFFFVKKGKLETTKERK